MRGGQKKSDSGFRIRFPIRDSVRIDSGFFFRIFICSLDFLDIGPKSILFKNLDPESLIIN